VVASVRVGDVVAGKYRVERLLGSGGMGSVYAARQIELDRLVAIKFLGAGDLPDDEARARLRSEAKAAGRLKGDHVARVHDVGVHGDDLPFLVMEYFDGEDLSAVAKRRGVIPVAEATDWILHACEALAEAHAASIIHRDVKLANLLLTKSASGQPLVKVLDFGVSKTLTESGCVTRTAAMLGSPKFMAPEQMEDPRSVDARSDVWSLGVCLYRLVSGRAAFDGETLARVCTTVLHQTPRSIRSIRPDVPAGFARIVETCLEKDRARRFGDVAELAGALAPFASDPGAARERVERIAAELGVPMPRLGPPSMGPAARTTLDGAWATTHSTMRGPATAKTPVLGIALGGAAFVLGIAGLANAILVRAPASPITPSASVAAATAPPPPPAPSEPLPPPSASATVRGAPLPTTAPMPPKKKRPLPFPDDRK
jgi:serine/threonine-protein kinase